MNLKFSEFPEDLREVKEDHSATRRASACSLELKERTIMARRNIYKHSIELKKLTIKNSERYEFAKQLENIPYRGYEVEDITDGRKIVIVKPGASRHGEKCGRRIISSFL